MEITGTVTQLLEPLSGTSAKGDWKKESFVILEDKDQYPKSICIEAFNKDFSVKLGDKVCVSINIESREYNGRWYTTVSAWKVDLLNAAQPNHEAIPEPGIHPLETDDLPF